MPRATNLVLATTPAEQRYVAWFHELDAWTEYWDIYHPETKGHFYFGDGQSEPGLLSRLLPRADCPEPFAAWKRMAQGDLPARFMASLRDPGVTQAVLEIDVLQRRLFEKHFGDASDANIRTDYFEAIFRFAIDTLPGAPEREAMLAVDDPRRSTAGRHTLDGDLMWFAWAFQLEAADAIVDADAGHACRNLLLAGVALGCAANFTWRGHRRTRSGYRADEQTAQLLRLRASQWALDFSAAAQEVHALFRIREWGSE